MSADDDTLLAYLDLALSLCQSGKQMTEWTTKNRRAIKLLPETHKEKLREAYRAQRFKLEKENGGFA